MTEATLGRQPWTMLPDSSEQWLVMDETGRRIVATVKSKEVAALIVRAVNRAAHFTPLMEALETLLAIVDESVGIDGWHLNGAVAPWGEVECISDLRDAYTAAREAAS